MRQRTITERIAKRIRRGQAWRGSVGSVLILEWAAQYANVRRK